MQLANALWGQAGLGYLQTYLHVLQSFYASELQQVDFSADPEWARTIINSWVAPHTRDKIPELLPTDVLTPLTLLVLTNAVYFKAQWDEAFEERLTETASFILENNTTVATDMMRQTATFRYTQDDLAQVLELPYAGNRLSMLIILPWEQAGLAELESHLSFEQLHTWQTALSRAVINVWLPEFRVRQPMLLADVLQRMGMGLAFTEAADFSGMTNDAPLMIGQVLHEAFINVDEKGTEAAAATAVVMLLGSAADDEERPPIIEFHADHPFMYAITDVTNSALLFLGRMKAPGP